MINNTNNKSRKSHRSHPVKTWMKFPLIAALCTACSAAPVSEHTMNQYIAQNYGSAELIKQKKGDKSITYFYKDNEYGFEYWIRSFSSGFSMDGSTFFPYEDKDSDFEEQYYAAVTGQLSEAFRQLEEQYHVTITAAEIKAGGYTVKSFGLADVTLGAGNLSSAAEISQAVADLYLAKDTRKFWREGRVNVYTADHESFGCFDISEGRYVTLEETDVERFQILAEQKDKSSQYQYLKTVSMEEFLQDTGISRMDLQNGTNETVTLYYFSTKSGKLYYIADVIYQGDLFSTFSQP